MKLECLRIRDGGTKVQLDDDEYHFKPQPDGRHIAEVTKTAHIKTLLAIEAYRIADEGVAEQIAPKPKSVKEAAAAPTDPAKTDAPPTGEAGEGDDGKTDPAPGTAPEGSTVTGGTDPAPRAIDDLTNEELKQAYTATLGKAPGNLGRVKLIAALEAAGYVAPAAA